LAEKLESVGGDLGKGGEKFKEDLGSAGAELVARVQEIAQNLATGAKNLDTAAGSVKLAMNDLEVTMLEASNIGKRGALFVNEALEKTGQTFQDLGVITNGLVTASSDFNAVAGKISEVVDNVEELSREQRGVVAAVREVAPTAQAAVERVATVLEHAGQHTKDSMEATAASLTRTVSSITEGLSSYTDLVAELHRKMDANLAKAVGNFHTHVNELTEAVEELSEIMQQKKG
jgi:methyl-accepting chemotaxis protein